eukprot:gene21987-28462_t
MIVWPSFWLPSYSTGCYDDGIIVPLCQKVCNLTQHVACSGLLIVWPTFWPPSYFIRCYDEGVIVPINPKLSAMFMSTYELLDTSKVFPTGWTALHRAAYNGHMTTVSLLLQQGADIQAKTNEGWTVLHEAAVNGHTAIVALILEQGADIGSMNNNGWTALHGAASSGHTTVVLLFLEQGADIEAKTNNGKRAVDLAKKEETKNLLQTWKPPSQDGAERQQYRENKASRKPSICTFHTANRSAITPESLSSATLSTSLPTGSGTAPASVWSKSTLAGLARFSNVYSLAIGFIILFIFYRLMVRSSYLLSLQPKQFVYNLMIGTREKKTSNIESSAAGQTGSEIKAFQSVLLV